MSATVSVVLPVLDGERHLEAALDSIARQTRRPDEVIVVDDGCTDRSREIAAARPWVTLVDGPCAGIAPAYAAGIQASTGALVGFLGQDDTYMPDAIATLATALGADPGAGLAAGQVQLWAQERFPALREDRLDRPYAARIPETVLIRRTVLDDIGGIDVVSQIAWDLDLFLRIAEHGHRTATVDVVIARKLLQPSSAIHSSADISADGLAALHRSLRRRRGATP